ncbi:MAG: hypothetical protein M1826_000798 [Phylliscum demangeonii]|nr:MAG: hypothetical protein M1826_000798 [Phylliscum demangeonii]
MATTPSARATLDPERLYQQVEAFGWSEDRQFQAGLSKLLHDRSPAEQVDEVTLRARCFYYSRREHVAVDPDGYRSWRQHRQLGALAGAAASTGPANGTAPSPVRDAATTAGPGTPYPVAFVEIAELIALGRAVPGIRRIPDTVLDGRDSPSAAATRRKPWEGPSHAAARDGAVDRAEPVAEVS